MRKVVDLFEDRLAVAAIVLVRRIAAPVPGGLNVSPTMIRWATSR